MKSSGIAVFIISICVPLSLSLSPSLDGSTLNTKYFDLSYDFDSDTIYFPGQLQYELHMDYINVSKAGFTYSAFSFCMGEHGGTHLDAPFHFNPAGWTVDQIPPTNLIDVPAVLIDVEKYVNELAKPHEFNLNLNHIEEHEKSHGKIQFSSVVLINTGWSKFWPNKIKYLGWDNSTGDEAALNFPGISGDTAKWLADERQILGIGLDTASIDKGIDKGFLAHVVLAQKQVYNLENIANLRSILNDATEGCKLRLFVLLAS